MKLRARTLSAYFDILQEIKVLNRQDQAYFYAQTGKSYWEYDRKEAIYWLTKGVEIGISPATEYKDNKEKLSALWNMLHNVLEKDAVLANKIIAKIKEIKIDESNVETLEEANKTYILIAEQLLHRKGDETSALEFAMLSLKGKRPAIDRHSVRFLLRIMFRNENLANTYFAKLLESAKNNGRLGLAISN